MTITMILNVNMWTRACWMNTMHTHTLNVWHQKNKLFYMLSHSLPLPKTCVWGNPLPSPRLYCRLVTSEKYSLQPTSNIHFTTLILSIWHLKFLCMWKKNSKSALCNLSFIGRRNGIWVNSDYIFIFHGCT